MKKRLIQLFTVLAVAAVPATAVADDAKTEAKPDVTITITGNDTMKFDKATFEVTEGQTVELVFKNIGKLPKQAMGHNLVILKPGTAIPAFAGEAFKHKDKEYLPQSEDHKKAIVAATKILGPGEQETIRFKAGAPGAYPYICSFPGHYALMKGVMTVKAK